MSEKKIASFEDMREADGIEYDTVDAYGITVQLGSASSATMIEWSEGNNDPAKKREAGLRLLVKSLVNDNKERVPEDKIEEMMASFRKKSSKENNKVIAKVLTLNGLDKVVKVPNVSSEAPTDGSPTGSASPSEK